MQSNKMTLYPTLKTDPKNVLQRTLLIFQENMSWKDHTVYSMFCLARPESTLCYSFVASFPLLYNVFVSSFFGRIPREPSVYG